MRAHLRTLGSILISLTIVLLTGDAPPARCLSLLQAPPIRHTRPFLL